MARRQWKTMSDEDRDREYSQRLERGLSFIDSDLPQFRPRDGQNFIRIVPPLLDDDLADSWGVLLICHYVEGFGWILSPKTLEQSNHDPVDDLIRELRRIDPELEDLVKTSRKFLMHVLDFNQDEKYGVLKLYAAPNQLVDDFVKAAKDNRTGRTYSLEDPENGFPLSFDKSGTGLQTRYSTVQLDRDPYPLEEETMDEQVYLADAIIVEEDDELKRICEKILDSAEAGGGRRRGRGGRGRDDDGGDEPRSRGRGRGRDDDDDRGRGRGRGRDDDDDRGRGRGRGRGRDDDGDEREPPPTRSGRGRGRGRDDDGDGEGSEVEDVKDRVADKIGRSGGRGSRSGRGEFSRRGRDDDGGDDNNGEEGHEEEQQEEREDPPPRTSRGRSSKKATKKKASGSRRSSRK